MIKNFQTILFFLFILMTGLSHFASASNSTPLDGHYQFFDSEQSFKIVHNLTGNYNVASSWFEECNMFFDIDSTTKQFSEDTSVDEQCMEVSGSQGPNWIWFKPASNDTQPWSADEGATATLSNNFGNLSIYSVTGVNGGETENFDVPFAVTKNGVFALVSQVFRDINKVDTWPGGDKVKKDTVEFDRRIALQTPSSALSTQDVSGRYALYVLSNETACSSPVGGTPGVNCTELSWKLATVFVEIVFDGNGGCTIPRVSKKIILQLLGNSHNKRILYKDDYIFSSDINSGALGNAAYKYNAGTIVASDWGITSCTYSISNNNEMSITKVEFDNVHGPDTYTLNNIILSSDANYFKYAGGVVNEEDSHNVMPSYFGMKMHETPATDLAGRTYLIQSFSVFDRAYDMNTASLNQSVYKAKRYALTFGNDPGSCAIDLMYNYKTSVVDTVSQNKLDSVGSYVDKTCSYIESDDHKKIKVTIANTDGSKSWTYSTRFSDDYNVIKMNHKSGTSIGTSALDEWELELSKFRIKSGFGVLIDDSLSIQEKNNAISAWVDPKYWLNINSYASLVPIINYLLF